VFLWQPRGNSLAVSGATRLPQHARQLIERGWTQYADARRADGSIVHPCDGGAVSWSLLGALVVAVEGVAVSEGEHAAIGELARTCVLLAEIVDSDSLEEWNDAGERTREDVLAALEQAATEVGQADGFLDSSPN
jgi:hypothetical protein